MTLIKMATSAMESYFKYVHNTVLPSFLYTIQVLKTMVGNNLTDKQLQEIVDKTILYADKDGDGKISFEEFCDVSR